LENYQHSFGRYPPAFVVDEEGKPMHSWRALILRHIEEGDLYDKYDFTKPWNSPENQKLAEQSDIWAYHSSFLRDSMGPKNRTDYVAVLGEDTFWGPDGKPRSLRRCPKGFSNTVILIDINHSDISWHEPRDLTVDDFLADEMLWSRTGVYERQKSAFYIYPNGGGHGVLCGNGEVRILRYNPTPDQIRRLFSVTEPYDWDAEAEKGGVMVPLDPPRPIVFRHIVFYVWIATLIAMFIDIFVPIRKVWEPGYSNR
jgi:hypothetical protein